ncbi:MAG: SIS domain-containing protein [Bacillota bacterium]
MGAHTWQEIQSQPQAWESALSAVRYHANLINSLINEPQVVDEIVLVGCGSSYYLALSAAATFQRLLGIPSRAIPSSEAIFYPESVFRRGKSVLVVGISRSGETTETLVALGRAASSPGVRLMSVSCRQDTELARLGGFHLYLPGCDEVSVVMTRSFSAMLLALQGVAALGAGNVAWFDRLSGLPVVAQNIVDAALPLTRSLGSDGSIRRFVFLGSGPFYGIACEGMLKIKEMALANSEAYHTLEFRHGPMSVLDANTLVVSITSDVARREESELLQELQSLSARTLAVGAPVAGAEHVVELPVDRFDEWARAALAIVPLQLLAYCRATSEGFDPDRPQHLSRVVRLGF